MPQLRAVTNTTDSKSHRSRYVKSGYFGNDETKKNGANLDCGETTIPEKKIQDTIAKPKGSTSVQKFLTHGWS